MRINGNRLYPDENCLVCFKQLLIDIELMQIAGWLTGSDWVGDQLTTSWLLAYLVASSLACQLTEHCVFIASFVDRVDLRINSSAD